MPWRDIPVGLPLDPLTPVLALACTLLAVVANWLIVRSRKP